MRQMSGRFFFVGVDLSPNNRGVKFKELDGGHIFGDESHHTMSELSVRSWVERWSEKGPLGFEDQLSLDEMRLGLSFLDRNEEPSPSFVSPGMRVYKREKFKALPGNIAVGAFSISVFALIVWLIVRAIF